MSFKHKFKQLGNYVIYFIITAEEKGITYKVNEKNEILYDQPITESTTRLLRALEVDNSNKFVMD